MNLKCKYIKFINRKKKSKHHSSAYIGQGIRQILLEFRRKVANINMYKWNSQASVKRNDTVGKGHEKGFYVPRLFLINKSKE